MNWLAAFAVMVVLDFIWARYTQYTVAKRQWAAGGAAAAITVCNSVMTLLVVDNPWMILPCAAGAFVGTAIAIKWHP